MKIAVPTMGDGGLEELVGEHFGRVPAYTVTDTETGRIEMVPNTSHHMGGQGYPPELLHTAGVEILLCRGLGRRAVAMFEEMGIRVFVGAHGTVEEALHLWRQGGLQEATDENACQQHAFRRDRGCDHDHEH